MKQILCGILTFTTLLAQADCNPDITPTAPDDRFVINSDNTVTDTKTNLTWMRCSIGQIGNDCSRGTAIAKPWSEALATAEASTFAGKEDWRLPNIKELWSIVEYSCRPAINSTIFPNTLSGRFGPENNFEDKYYWSSSIVSLPKNNAVAARYMSFEDPYDGYIYKQKQYFIRLVRGGL